jgi:hypothetical protein
MEVLSETRSSVEGTVDTNPLLKIMQLPNSNDAFVQEMMKAPVQEIQYNLPDNTIFHMTRQTVEDWFGSEVIEMLKETSLLDVCIELFGLNIADKDNMSLSQIANWTRYQNYVKHSSNETREPNDVVMRAKRTSGGKHEDTDDDDDEDDEEIPQCIGMGLPEVQPEKVSGRICPRKKKVRQTSQNT